eukprot:TRINITY_DN14352_c0_g4_i1.p1 TRINITY_DN14352_c0_g4~~TRINITY_DN14352_c0_g4_i1.p1  ORF type:complete len:355 (-),score=27.24 TRINITY_DN14352_c0_g4_i1:33-1097(-)
MRGRARDVATCAAIFAVTMSVAGEDVVDAPFMPSDATQLRRQAIRRAKRKGRIGVIWPSFRDGIMLPAAGVILDAAGNTQRAEITMIGSNESSDAATAATASGRERDALGFASFTDVATGTVDGASLPSNSHSSNGSWLNLKGKNTTQSSTYGGVKGDSKNAVDGLSDNEWEHATCATTSRVATKPQWWEIDLQDNFSITHVRLLRENAFIEKISPFSVAVDGRKCINGAVFPSAAFEHDFDCNAFGRRVRVTKSPMLVVCEFKLRVKTWKQISATRICEGYFDPDRADQRIKPVYELSHCSLEACQTSCQRESECRSIDWFAGTCLCHLYRAACPANMTRPAHNEGSSHELES